MASPYTGRFGLRSQKWDREIAIHLTYLLTSCITVVLWGIILIYKAGTTGGVSWFQIIVIELIAMIGVGALIHSGLGQEGFVRRENYRNDIRIHSIESIHLIDAPISYWRIALAISIILIPFIRIGIV